MYKTLLKKLLLAFTVLTSVMVRLLRRIEISINSWLTAISAFWLRLLSLPKHGFLLNTSVMVRLLRRIEISINSWLTAISAFWLMAFYFLLNTSASIACAQTISLIVAHYDPAAVKTLTQHIYRYTFENGEYKGKEKLLTVNGKENGKDYVRCDVGENNIYKNRFLISGCGNIIDLKERKIISAHHARLVKSSGDSLIFYTNDVFRGKFYSVFNCNTLEYKEVKDLLFKAIPGQDAEVDYSETPRKIWLYPPDKEKQLLVNNAGFGEHLIQQSQHAEIPLYWIDNTHLLYPNYNTEQTALSLMLLDVKTREQTNLGSINGIVPARNNSGFTHDALGRLIYRCEKGIYVIDLQRQVLSQIQMVQQGNNFEVEYASQDYGHTITYSLKEIGKYHFGLNSVKTCKTAIAFAQEVLVGGEAYPQGLAVWNSVTKKWKTIDAEEVAAVIGWIEN